MKPSSCVLSYYHAKGEDLFDQIVTRDKRWVHQLTPENEECIEAVGSEK